jgi:dienelactone hydrolase
MVITICGSTRFKKEIEAVAHDLTLQGHIVLAPCVFHHQEEEEISTETKIQLDNLHREKINMSDAIFVVNVDGYIGESTYGEIDWANRMKKQIFFLVEPPKQETNENTSIEDNETAPTTKEDAVE